MSEIVDSRDAWPFPALHQRRADDVWFRISAADRDALLNAVPPIYIPGGFLVGEEVATTPTGEPIYTAIVEPVSGWILARHIPVSQRRSAAALAHGAIAEAME